MVVRCHLMVGIVALAAGCDDHILGEPPEGEAPSAYTCDWVGVQEFFADKCDVCHSGESPIGGFDLVTTIESELNGGSPFYVVPSDAPASRLWQSISGTGTALLMPQGAATPLDEAQIGHVRCWIDAGAPL